MTLCIFTEVVTLNINMGFQLPFKVFVLISAVIDEHSFS